MITLVLGSGLLATVVLSTLISLLVDFDEGFWPAQLRGSSSLTEALCPNQR